MASIKFFSEFKFTKILTRILVGIFLLVVIFLLPKSKSNPQANTQSEDNIVSSFDQTKLKSDEQWKKILTAEQFHILREKGTDLPFTKEMTNNHEKGTYVSVGCNQPVFRSETKFDSGTGWPSFYAPINENALVLKKDYDLGYERIEIMDKCGGHLGHVFNDGPKPTGKRYCINATALKFIPD